MERANVKEQLERMMNEFNQKSDELQKMAEKSVNGTMERYTLAQARCNSKQVDTNLKEKNNEDKSIPNRRYQRDPQGGRN